MMRLFVFCILFICLYLYGVVDSFAYTEQTKKKSLVFYVSQRSIRLLVPYFLLSIVGLLPKIMAASVLNDKLEMDFIQIIRAFFVPREGVWGHFWFLPMIYITGILGYGLDKLVKLSVVGWIIITAISFGLSFVQLDVLQWLAINDVLHFFVYYALGIVVGRIKGYDLNKKYEIVIACVGLLLFLILFFYVHGALSLQHVRNFLIACCMIIFIVNLCRLLENRITVCRTSLMAQTYQIFILSWPCQLIVGIVIERILRLNWQVFIPVVFLSGILFPLLILRIMDKIETKINFKILSFVIGRQVIMK